MFPRPQIVELRPNAAKRLVRLGPMLKTSFQFLRKKKKRGYITLHHQLSSGEWRMDQSDLGTVVTQAAQRSKNVVTQQVDRQASALGATLSQTARDLETVGSNLRTSGTIGRAAEVADWAANYVERAASYLSNGHTDLFLTDIESFGRERPWAIAASAAALGFIVSRIVKSSSARRYDASTSTYGYTTGANDERDTRYSDGAVSAASTDRLNTF